MPVTAATTPAAKRMPCTARRARAEKERDVENSPHERKPAHVDAVADVAVGAYAQLGEDPGGNQQQRQGLLRLVAQQHPAGQRGQRPQQDGIGPVVIEVEDFAHQHDGGAAREGSHGVERDGEAAKVSPCYAAGNMKDRDQRDDKHKTRPGTELIPVGRDKEDEAADDQDGGEKERRHAKPA